MRVEFVWQETIVTLCQAKNTTLIKFQVRVWKYALKHYGQMISLGHVSATVTLSTLSIKFSTEIITIKDASHYVHQILMNMLMIPQATVWENAQLDHMLTFTQVSENVLLLARLTIFTLTIQQTDASTNALPTHSCSQTSQYTSACSNAKIPIDSQTIRPRHASRNVLQPGSCGVSVSITLVCSFAPTHITQTCWTTVNASCNAQPQGSLISGHLHVWLTAAMFAKITTKTPQQVRVCAWRCAQEIVMDTTLVRHASIKTWQIYLRLAQILTTPIEPPNYASSSVLQEPMPTKSLSIVKSDAQGLTLPIPQQGSAWLDVLPTTLRMFLVPPIILVCNSAPHRTTLKTQPWHVLVHARRFINWLPQGLVRVHVPSLSSSIHTRESRIAERIAPHCLPIELNDNVWEHV